MKINQLSTALCMGICMTDATYALPSAENQQKVVVEPDYAIPNKPICEMEYTPESTHFSLWAPSAIDAEIRIYKSNESPEPEEVILLDPDMKGSWEQTVNKDLKGKFYTFRVNIDDVWQKETPGIFARAVGVNGDRAAIIDFNETNPDGWNADIRPVMKNPADIVIYEMHHRDFSIHSSSGIKNKGKFIALTEHGTSTRNGEKTGIDHLKELGITHVHILPSFDFASIDETKLESNAYNWGYDPKNYNVPDGSYSTDPYDPKVRIREFKEMVQALHKAGIRVVMDVVYNHTFSVADSPFERTVPGYFFRMYENGEYCNGSACGNETASNHKMMQKYMIESVCYWAKEYHVDGFRFDLMAVHDIETMNAVRSALDKIDPTILTYGEGWAVGQLGYDENKMAYKKYTFRMPRIATFSDNLRDGLRDPFSDDHQGGFLAGVAGKEEEIKFGIAGGILHKQIKSNNFWASEPTQHISYVSCHDDHCLRDRLINTLDKNTSEETILKLDKLAQTVVLTSQGIPFIFGGEELFRTKKGIGNSYNCPDEINAINWNNKTKYQDLFDYYKEIIAIRRMHPAFYLGKAEKVRKHLDFLPTEKENIVAFQLKDIQNIDSARRIVVVLNSNKTEEMVSIPNASYKIIVQNGKANRNGLDSYQGSHIQVDPQSALILIEE